VTEEVESGCQYRETWEPFLVTFIERESLLLLKLGRNSRWKMVMHGLNENSYENCVEILWR